MSYLVETTEVVREKHEFKNKASVSSSLLCGLGGLLLLSEETRGQLLLLLALEHLLVLQLLRGQVRLWLVSWLIRLSWLSSLTRLSTLLTLLLWCLACLSGGLCFGTSRDLRLGTHLPRWSLLGLLWLHL